MADPFSIYSTGSAIADAIGSDDRSLPPNNLLGAQGLFTRPVGQFAGQVAQGNLGGFAAQKNAELLGSSGRTSPDLFNRVLAGSNRATESVLRDHRSSESRSGTQSGIGRALAAAIGLEGADREAGIRAQEGSIAEERRRADLDRFTQNVLDPILAAMGIDAGVQTSRAQINAQQGNQELQAIATLLGGLTQLGGRRGGGGED